MTISEAITQVLTASHIGDQNFRQFLLGDAPEVVAMRKALVQLADAVRDEDESTTCIECIAWIVKDSQGETAVGVVNEAADTVHVCGMKTPSGDPVYFEAEFYHLREWCDVNGLTLLRKTQCVEMSTNSESVDTSR